ncbi:MAG: hypothetical protein ACTSPB_24065 [Candidatus Thorarchaeota archaeon]
MKNPTTYKNEYGESMHIRNEYVLTVDHADVGKIYFLPVGDGSKVRAFAASGEPVSFEGEELKHPETGETLMIHTYSQVVLNQKEMDIIHAHTQG